MKKTAVMLVFVSASLAIALFAAPSSGASPAGQPAKAANVTTLHIEGMTCGACSTAVGHVVKNIDGVKDAKVSYKEKQAVITYDASKVTPQMIVRTITEKLPTYKATVIQ